MQKSKLVRLPIVIFSLLFFVFLVAFSSEGLRAQGTKVVSKEEFYINEDNVSEVEITGNVAKEDLIAPGMVVRVSLKDEVGNEINRIGLIDQSGEFKVVLDATSLLDGEIILNAVVMLQEGEQYIGRGGIKREEKIYDNLRIIKDTLSPLRLSLYSVTTPTSESEQTIKGDKPKNTSVWLNGSEIVGLNEETLWAYRLRLNEGDNRLSLTVKDKGGNESEPVEAVIIYDPTLNRASVTAKERADSSGVVDIEVTFLHPPSVTPQIVINTASGEDVPPTDLTGSENLWQYEYQGSRKEGEGLITVLLRDPSSDKVEVVPLEKNSFKVEANIEKEEKSQWKLPPPPSAIEKPLRPEILTSTTIQELDTSVPEIVGIKILDPFPNYKNGATVHLDVEYEDETYEVIKNFLHPEYGLDARYSYIEKNYDREGALWYPIRSDFSNLDSNASSRIVRVGEAIKVGTDRYRRTVSHKIDLENARSDSEVSIPLKVSNLLGKSIERSVKVRLVNNAPVSLDKEVLLGFEDPLGEDISQISLKGILKKDSPSDKFIALFIYSDPVVETIKTDKFGNWTYTLKRPLDSGEHLIYGAEIDDRGNLGEVVQLASFVVPAIAAEDESSQAVNIEDLETVVEKVKLPEVKQAQRKSTLTEIIIFLILFISSGVVIVLGFGYDIFKRYRQKQLMGGKPLNDK